MQSDGAISHPEIEPKPEGNLISSDRPEEFVDTRSSFVFRDGSFDPYKQVSQIANDSNYTDPKL